MRSLSFKQTFQMTKKEKYNLESSKLKPFPNQPL